MQISPNELSFHEEVLENLPDAVIWSKPVIDANDHIIDFEIHYANQKANELVNYHNVPLKGLYIKRDCIPHRMAAEENFHNLLKVYQTGQFDEYSFQSCATDARVETVRRRFRDGVLSTSRDRKAQREAAIEIEQQKVLLDNILKNSPSGIVVYKAIRNREGKTEDLQCIIANDAAEQITQIPNKLRFAKPVSQALSGFYKSPLFQLAISTLETGIPAKTQYFQAPIQRWLEFSASNLDKDRLIIVISDITETKETQLQLETLVDELKRSNADLEDFAHVASHDLQEPLRKIRTFTDRLKRELEPQLSTENRQMFERMESAAARMKTLIHDLLAYSQVSKNPGVLEKVDLNDTIHNVLQDTEASINETEAKVLVDDLPSIQGNAPQLRQLFQNLIGNAIKYRKTDTNPEILIKCRLINDADPLRKTLPATIKENYYLIEVSDNGIGFEQEYAQKIFKVFQRLHGRSEYEGTGVGLAIVQKVVANHKGFICAQSEPGEGATFRVFLPAW